MAQSNKASLLLITVDHNYFASKESLFEDTISPVVFFEPSGMVFGEEVQHFQNGTNESSLEELSRKISQVTTIDNFVPRSISENIATLTSSNG